MRLGVLSFEDALGVQVKRFPEEQIMGFLQEVQSDLSVADLCRRHRGQLLPLA